MLMKHLRMGVMMGWWGKLRRWLPWGNMMIDEPSLSTTRTIYELMEDLLSLMVCLVPDEEFNLDYSTLTSLLARNIQGIIKLYLKLFLYFPITTIVSHLMQALHW